MTRTASTQFHGLAMAVLATTAIAAAAPAGADAIRAGEVAPDARWLLHIDVEALRASASFRALLTEDGPLPRLSRDLAHLRELTALEPVEVLESITMYGSSYRHGEAIVVLESKTPLEEAVSKYAAGSDLTKTEETIAASPEAPERRVISLRRGDRDRGSRHLTFVNDAARSRHYLVLADDRDDLIAAAGRVEQSLAPAESEPGAPTPPPHPLVAETKPGTVLLCAADELSPASHGRARSATARRLESLSLVSGEAEGRSFVDVDATAAEGEDAAALASMAEGTGRWLGVLAGPDAKDLTSTTERSDNEIRVRISMSQADFPRIIGGLVQRFDRAQRTLHDREKRSR